MIVRGKPRRVSATFADEVNVFAVANFRHVHPGFQRDRIARVLDTARPNEDASRTRFPGDDNPAAPDRIDTVDAARACLQFERHVLEPVLFSLRHRDCVSVFVRQGAWCGA